MAGNFLWGQPFNTNGYNGYWPNPGVKTDGIGMPTARLDFYGARPIYIGNIYRGYAAGPGSIWQGIYYQGVETQGGYVFPSSGGPFTFFIRGSAGTLRFGRDQPAGRQVIAENDGYTWDGTLAGSLDWAEVPTPPQGVNIIYDPATKMLNPVMGASADNGGSGIGSYWREYQVNGGTWVGYGESYASLIPATPGATYRARYWARNGVGNSEPAYTPFVTIPYSGGRRMTGPSASTPITTSKRHDGTAWVDLVTRKRHNGSAWVDISN